MNQPADKPRRFRIRFSLRTLLLCTLVIGLACGWLGSILYRQHRQRQILKHLGVDRVHLAYDYQIEDGSLRTVEPPGPWFMCRCFGDDLFASVAYLHLDKPASAEHCQLLLELPRLKHLSATLDRESLAVVAKIPELESLWLDGPHLQPDDLVPLAEYPNLQKLYLVDTKVTGRAFEHIRRIPRLRGLHIQGGPNIDDAALEHLAGLTQLQELSLLRTNITADGLTQLVGMQSLQQLILNGPPMTGAGCQSLVQLKSIRSLDLMATNLTAEGLRELRKLPHLESLTVDESIDPIRAAELRDAALELHKHLPDCKVTVMNGRRCIIQVP